MDNVKEKLDAMVKDYDQARIKGSPDEMVVTSSYLKRALEDAYRSGDLVTREELEAAVEAEREVCAAIADRNARIQDHEPSVAGALDYVGQQIRARGET